MTYTRRDFIKTSAAARAAAGLVELAALPSGDMAAAELSRMVTLSDWLQVDRDARKRGLELCL